jgi:hypothetical protein
MFRIQSKASQTPSKVPRQNSDPKNIVREETSIVCNSPADLALLGVRGASQ